MEELPGYDVAACERRVPDPSIRSGRTPFVRDRARVLHAASLRRLSAKTQVLGPGTDDFVRNRLTHSLEVGQIARELGQAVGCDPDLVETAALAHDLGHPPFGHNGERALAEAADDCGGFEGNAQTFRILTRLEAKTADPSGASVGLNLTRASLDACLKYPWTTDDAPQPVGLHADGTPRVVRKFGVYDDDLPTFTWVRTAAPSAAPCVEAQVMDLSDDVAYSVHDVEDAVVGGQLRLSWLDSASERAGVWEAVRDWYLPGADDDQLDAALARLRGMPAWPDVDYDRTRSALARLKGMTSALIGRFCTAAQQATSAQVGEGPVTRYRADLVVPGAVREEIAVLKGIAAHYVMRRDERVAPLALQREQLATLVDHLSKRPDRLDADFAADHAAAQDDRGRLRAVVDQVASLTDLSARTWAAKLVGLET